MVIGKTIILEEIKFCAYGELNSNRFDRAVSSLARKKSILQSLFKFYLKNCYESKIIFTCKLKPGWSGELRCPHCGNEFKIPRIDDWVEEVT